ncbi:MAG TPA: hypothetical protein VFD08_03940 [Clostridia bacterium]|nr:hypothetical protein [Clostridia bacterium]
MSAQLYVLFIFGALLYYWAKNIRKNKKRLEELKENFGLLGRSRYKSEDLDVHYLQKKENTGKPRIDSITWDDLEMEDFLLKTQCFYSSLGAAHIYESFHYLEEEEVLSARKKLIAMEKKDRECTIKHLFYLGSESGVNLPFFIQEATEFFLPYWLLQGLFYLIILALLALVFLKGLGLVFFGMIVLINVIIYARGTKKIRSQLHNVNYFQRMLKSARHLEKELSQDLVDFKKELQEALAPFKGLRISPLGQYTNTSELSVIRENMEVFFLSSLRQYTKIAGLLEKNRAESERVMELLGELELALYVQALKENKTMCKADFVEEKELSFDGLYHPMVEDAVAYSRKKTKRLLVTGSNASGKSTLMKSMALSVLFSQVTGYAFAKRFSLHKGELLSSMALRDSIEKKESYFVTEIKSLRRILEKTKESFSYCFIDEILRGTNTIERIAASSSVLESLAKTKSCIYVASHDIELTELLTDYSNVHFREKYLGDDIVFDYKLLEGPSESTNAILLLKVMGFGDEIILEAQSRVENFLDTRSWRKGI